MFSLLTKEQVVEPESHNLNSCEPDNWPWGIEYPRKLENGQVEGILFINHLSHFFILIIVTNILN